MDKFLPIYYVIFINHVTCNSINYILQALLEEKQKEEDIEKIKKSFSQLMQEAATRAKKEVRGFLLYLKFKILQLKTQFYLSFA